MIVRVSRTRWLVAAAATAAAELELGVRDDIGIFWDFSLIYAIAAWGYIIS